MKMADICPDVITYTTMLHAYNSAGKSIYAFAGLYWGVFVYIYAPPAVNFFVNISLVDKGNLNKLFSNLNY